MCESSRTKSRHRTGYSSSCTGSPPPGFPAIAWLPPRSMWILIEFIAHVLETWLSWLEHIGTRIRAPVTSLGRGLIALQQHFNSSTMSFHPERGLGSRKVIACTTMSMSTTWCNFRTQLSRAHAQGDSQIFTNCEFCQILSCCINLTNSSPPAYRPSLANAEHSLCIKMTTHSSRIHPYCLHVMHFIK